MAELVTNRNFWKAAITMPLVILTELFGIWDALLEALIILVVLDVVTGVTRAFIQQKLSSNESFKGIARKVLIFCMVAVAVQVDRLAGTDQWLRTITIAFYCGSEGLSVVENSVAAGLPAPEFLKSALAQLRKKGAENAKFTGESEK